MIIAGYIFLTIALIITGILLYLLFAPFYLEIDSREGLFMFRFHNIARVRLAFENQSLLIKINALGWHKSIDLFAPRPKKPAEEKPAKKKSSFKPAPKRIWNVIRSFRITQCKISIDTGDVVANAWLYPLMVVVSSRTGKSIAINFWGETEFILHIQNSISRMIWAYTKPIIN